MTDIDPISQIFEFERKFFVRELPGFVAEHGHHNLIIQGYVLAEDGYAIRVRVLVPDHREDLSGFDPKTQRFGAFERSILARVEEKVSGAWITVKSPPVAAERYELDQILEPSVALNILQRCPTIIVKNRHSIWIGEDGWELDEFGGQNSGLVIAECERTGPVVDLEIPEFCVTEVSNDHRFTNDYLSKNPWTGWAAEYVAELAAKGPFFENYS